MLLEDLAKELVEVTSSLVGGRTVNIMNTDGIIVASTEQSRIGTFHQGALEAARFGKLVSIRSDQLKQYPGAREGLNMPLRVGGSTIGVVGLRGEPSEIQYLAKLLEVYAAKYYQLEAIARPRLAESELRSRLLGFLLMPTRESIGQAQALMDSMNLRLEFPLTVEVISFLDDTYGMEQAHLIDFLSGHQLLKTGQDVWGMVNDRLILLRKEDGISWRRLKEEDSNIFFQHCRLSISDPCLSIWDIHQGYEQASALDRMSETPFNDIGQLSTRCDYMLYTTSACCEEFMEGLYHKLTAVFHEPELTSILVTARSYYDCSRSVSQAAKDLFIHKNTLQYRIRRLIEVLDLKKCTAFQQEYLIRLLLEYHKRKQST